MEKHEENGGAQGNPRDDVKNTLNIVQPHGRTNRRPKHQAVILAKHEKEHAGADLPAGQTVAAVQVKSDRAFADLLIHQGKNVGASADRQDIRVADFCVEPVNHGPNNQTVNQKIKKTVG